MIYLRKGTRLAKDEKSGYIVTRDIPALELMAPRYLEPYGDVPPPHSGEIIPGWVHDAIRRVKNGAD